MDELKVATKGSLMNEIDFYKEENKNLKDLLGEVYEMSFLEDIIDDDCRDRKDDEMLLCNLSLKSQVMEALHGKSHFPKRELAKELKSKITENGLRLKKDVAMLKHNSSKVTTDHYSKEDK